MAAKPIDLDHRAKVRYNLFESAHQAVEPWEKFLWHRGKNNVCDTYVRHSSQALAIDYFGTLKCIDQASRDAVLGAIALSLGLSPEGPWLIELEWQDAANLLNETKFKTQVDALAISPFTLIFFEANFGEDNGGCCSQTQPTKKGLIQCNGAYEGQVNPANNIFAPCALSGKGIRYWEMVPCFMKLNPAASYDPCPFKGSWYQWMRNMALAYAISVQRNKACGVVIVYADHSGLAFPRVLKTQDWKSFISQLSQEKVKLSTMTYQEICRLGIDADPPSLNLLVELQTWIEKKIEHVGRERLR